MINLAILSAKGGTGKTTLSIALAHEYALANPKREIVLIDADNQGNVGISLDLSSENTLGAFLHGATQTIDTVQYRAEIPFYVLESGRMHLYEAEKQIYETARPTYFIRDRLLPEFEAGSLLIWDLPPTLSIINDNVLAIADYIVIPTHTDYLSLTGITNLLTYLDHYREKYGARCKVLGIAVTLHREHVTQNRLNRESLHQAFPHLMFQQTIPLSTAIATTAQNHLTPLEAADARARDAYRALVREIHQRMMKCQEHHG